MGALSGRKTRPTKKLKLAEWARSRARSEGSLTSRSGCFLPASLAGRPSVWEQEGERGQPVGGEMLVSEGGQGFSELPLCPGVLESSPISVANPQQARPGLLFLCPDLPSRKLATAWSRACSLGQALLSLLPVQGHSPDSYISLSSSCLSQALRKGSVGALTGSHGLGPEWSEALPAKEPWR